MRSADSSEKMITCLAMRQSILVEIQTDHIHIDCVYESLTKKRDRDSNLSFNQIHRSTNFTTDRNLIREKIQLNGFFRF
jgi:hypothetical protein